METKALFCVYLSLNSINIYEHYMWSGEEYRKENKYRMSKLRPGKTIKQNGGLKLFRYARRIFPTPCFLFSF